MIKQKSPKVKLNILTSYLKFTHVIPQLTNFFPF